MTLQMHVLTIKDTGHILAAVARTNSGGDPDVLALAGRDLPVVIPRAQGDTAAATLIPVPADLLEVKALVYDPVVVAHPLVHVVDGGRITALPPPALTPTPSEIEGGKIKVNTAVGDVPVVVVVVGKDDPSIRRADAGKVPSGATTVDLTHTILPGEPPASVPTGMNYFLLIAEGGQRLRLELDNP
jgi:hypothetical protein